MLATHFNRYFCFALLVISVLSGCIEDPLMPDSDPHDIDRAQPPISPVDPQVDPPVDPVVDQAVCELDYYLIPHLVDGIVHMNWREITAFATPASSSAHHNVSHDDELTQRDDSRYELFVFHCPQGRYNITWKGFINEDSNGQLYINVAGGRGAEYITDGDAPLLPGSHEIELEGYRTDRDQVIALLVNATIGGHDTQYIGLVEQ